MPGLYLHFRPSGLDEGDLRSFSERMRRIAHAPDARVQRLDTDQIKAVVIDHGNWPSGGVASSPRGSLMLCGSCWLTGESTDLATTQQALVEYEARRDARWDEPLRGMYAMAYADARGESLTVETDRFGTVPIYYREDGRGGLMVASEIKFLVDPGRDRPDPRGLADFLAIGYLVRQVSPVAGITRLLLHHRLTFDDGRVSVARLPQPGYPRDLPVDRGALEELDRLAGLHFRRFMGHTKRMSIALSGGLDSRLLLYSAMRQGVELVGFTSGEFGNIDMREAKRLAAHVGIPIVAHEVDGRRLPEWFPYAVSASELRTPANHVHYFPALVAGDTPRAPQIHGLIGEASVGGYLEHDDYIEASTAERRRGCLAFAHESVSHWPKHQLEKTLSPELYDAYRCAHDDATDELLAVLGFAGSYSDYLDFRFIFRGGLFGVPAFTSQVLGRTDVISPFLDADFYDFSARLRSRAIRDRVVQLRWGTELMPGFADLPRVKDGMILPVRADDPGAYRRAIVKRQRRERINYIITRLAGGRVHFASPEGFPHYGQWYRRWPAVRAFVDGVLLNSEDALFKGMLQRDGVAEMLRQLRVGKNLWAAVGGLLMVVLFQRQIIAGLEPPTITPWHGSDHG